MKAEKENQKIPENQICMENCKDKATTDYNGCGHFVCDFHNGRLIDYLDEEIPIKIDAEQALLNIFSENTLVGQIKVINEYARIQIEKDRERIKANINFNDDGIKQAMEKLIDNTPITFCGLAKYRLAQMFKFSTKACGGILPNHCYNQ